MTDLQIILALFGVPLGILCAGVVWYLLVWYLLILPWLDRREEE